MALKSKIDEPASTGGPGCIDESNDVFVPADSCTCPSLLTLKSSKNVFSRFCWPSDTGDVEFEEWTILRSGVLTPAVGGKRPELRYGSEVWYGGVGEED